MTARFINKNVSRKNYFRHSCKLISISLGYCLWCWWWWLFLLHSFFVSCEIDPICNEIRDNRNPPKIMLIGEIENGNRLLLIVERTQKQMDSSPDSEHNFAMFTASANQDLRTNPSRGIKYFQLHLEKSETIPENLVNFLANSDPNRKYFPLNKNKIDLIIRWHGGGDIWGKSSTIKYYWYHWNDDTSSDSIGKSMTSKFVRKSEEFEWTSVFISDGSGSAFGMQSIDQTLATSGHVSYSGNDDKLLKEESVLGATRKLYYSITEELRLQAGFVSSHHLQMLNLIFANGSVHQFVPGPDFRTDYPMPSDPFEISLNEFIVCESINNLMPDDATHKAGTERQTSSFTDSDIIILLMCIVVAVAAIAIGFWCMKSKNYPFSPKKFMKNKKRTTKTTTPSSSPSPSPCNIYQNDRRKTRSRTKAKLSPTGILTTAKANAKLHLEKKLKELSKKLYEKGIRSKNNNNDNQKGSPKRQKLIDKLKQIKPNQATNKIMVVGPSKRSPTKWSKCSRSLIKTDRLSYFTGPTPTAIGTSNMALHALSPAPSKSI